MTRASAETAWPVATRHSYVSQVAKAVVCGFGIAGYGLAIDGLAALLGTKA